MPPTLGLESVGFSEASLRMYRISRHYVPQDGNCNYYNLISLFIPLICWYFVAADRWVGRSVDYPIVLTSLLIIRQTQHIFDSDNIKQPRFGF